MEYLVENHITGEYYVSNEDPEIIEKTCPECGDNDWIVLSYEEGQRLEALSNYFNPIKKSKGYIIDSYINGISKEEILEYTEYDYMSDKEMINNLFQNAIINEDEKNMLLRLVASSKRRQLEIIKSIPFSELKQEQPKTMIYNKK